MMWWDSDAMATSIWKQDPVDTLIRNKLVLLFSNFPQGTTRGTDLADRVVSAYNTSLCDLQLHRTKGHFLADYGDCPKYTGSFISRI